jgi:hypothetical protein
MSPRHVAVGLAASLLLASCSKPTDPSRNTETFTGLVDVGATSEHDFTVQQYGLVEITLTRLSPDSTLLMSVGIGEPTPTGCVLDTAGNVNAGSTPQLTGNATPGSWCVSIGDAGYMTAPESYTLAVTHP